MLYYFYYVYFSFKVLCISGKLSLWFVVGNKSKNRYREVLSCVQSVYIR